MTVLRARRRKARTQRRIAEAVWGKERVAAEWHPDGWMRSQVRRWIPRAEALAAGGWRDLVPRGRTDGEE